LSQPGIAVVSTSTFIIYVAGMLAVLVLLTLFFGGRD